jgi:hypothetical protein
MTPVVAEWDVLWGLPPYVLYIYMYPVAQPHCIVAKKKTSEQPHGPLVRILRPLGTSSKIMGKPMGKAMVETVVDRHLPLKMAVKWP